MSLLQKTKEITSCALLKSNEIIINTQAPCFGFPSASSLASRLLLFSLVFGQTRFCGKGLKCWRVIFAIETCDGLDSYPAIGLFSCNESYLFCDSRRKKCVCVCVNHGTPKAKFKFKASRGRCPAFEFAQQKMAAGSPAWIWHLRRQRRSLHGRSLS